MSTIKVNTITTRSGSTVTLGESGKTITLACGASQTGIVEHVVAARLVYNGKDITLLTATSGEGYFVNTTGGAVTVTLPASPSVQEI